MEVIHHFGIKLSCEDERQAFVDIGIELEPGARAPSGNIITSFEIGKHDPHWMGGEADFSAPLLTMRP
jgi:hypothetical protein